MFLPHHRSDNRLRTEEGPFQVGVDNGVPFPGFHESKQVVAVYAGIVDQHVHPVAQPDDLLEGFFDGLRVGHVEAAEVSRRAFGSNRRRAFRGCLGARTEVNHHRIPRFRKGYSYATPNPATGSGDNYDSFQRHVPPPLFSFGSWL